MERILAITSVGTLFLTAFLSTLGTADAVQPSGWLVAELIETENSGSGLYPKVAMDKDGNAIAVWQHYDGVIQSIWANRFTAGVGWGVAELIEKDDSGSAWYPQVAIDGTGNATAVWHQSDSTRNNIWANRFTSGLGWGKAQLIETDNAGNAFKPHVAMDMAGNAIAVWHQSDGVRYNILANRYTLGVGWGLANLIETNNAGSVAPPIIAMDASGNAIAVWGQSDGVRDNIWANRFAVGVGWGVARLIETDDIGGAYSPHIAMDKDGNAIVVWEQLDDTDKNIMSNRFTVSEGWGLAQLIETDNSGPAHGPHIVMDIHGDAIAVWHQYDGASLSVFSNRYTIGTGWGSAQLLETYDGNAYEPQVAMDTDGNAMAIWEQYDGTIKNIYANRYTEGVGWGTAQPIETSNAGATENPQIVMDPDGNAIAVWEQSDGTRYNIWANRYVKPDTTPPVLTVSTPIDGTTTESPIITVSGSSEPGALLYINGLSVAVLPDGSFSCNIYLFEGTNTIIVNASDISGNSVRVIRSVTCTDPMSSVLSDLAALEERIETLELSISNLGSDLEGLSSDISSIDAILNNISTALDAHQANLTHLKNLLEVLGTNLTGSKGNITELKDLVTRLERGLDTTQDEVEGLVQDLHSVNDDLNSTRTRLSSVESDSSDLREDRDSDREDIGALEDDLDAMKALNVVLIIGLLFTLLLLFVLFIFVLAARARKRDRSMEDE